MRNLSIVFITGVLLTASVVASARGFAHHGHGHHYRGHGYAYGGHSYHGGHGHHGAHAGYLLGGLALGALLTPRVVYLPPLRTTHVPRTHAPVTRRLLRDINGNCYERKTDGAGNELRIELPAAECAW